MGYIVERGKQDVVKDVPFCRNSGKHGDVSIHVKPIIKHRTKRRGASVTVMLEIQQTGSALENGQ